MIKDFGVIKFETQLGPRTPNLDIFSLNGFANWKENTIVNCEWVNRHVYKLYIVGVSINVGFAKWLVHKGESY